MWEFHAGGRSVVFGCDLRGVGLMAHPTIKTALSGGVYANPRGDGQRFGRQKRAGQTLSFPVEALADSRSLDEVWRALVAVWRADEVRNRAGALATVIAPSGRRVFGRPVDMAEDHSIRLYGAVRSELVFECVDDLWYGAEQWFDVLFAPPVGGGLTFPALAPFTFDAGPNSRNAAISVDGDVATWPMFEIHGPVTNPEVQIVGGARLVFATTLAYDQSLVVDTRPWARHVHRNGAAFPGALSPTGDRLADMSLTPGEHQIVLKGYDPTGTAKLRVRVAPAFTSF